MFSVLKFCVNNTFLQNRIALIKLICRNFSTLRIINWEWLDTSKAGDKRLLRAQLKSITYGPVSKDKSLTSVIQLPDIFSYKITNAKVHIRSSYFIKDSTIYIERIKSIDDDIIRFKSGHLLYKGKYGAIVRNIETSSINKGFFLGGNGCDNYYHWLIEMIPRLEFYPQFKEYPLLVSEDVGRINNFKEVLNAINHDVEIIYLKKDQQYIIEDLIYITSPNILPFLLNPGYKLKVEQFIFSPQSLKYIRDSIFDNLNVKNEKKDLKIFLKRGKNKREYNELEIENMLLGLGFVSVQSENIDFTEQVNIFNRASHIVGPTGAAWTNIVFSSNAKAICWMPVEIDEFSVFSSLAEFAGVDLKYIFYKSTLRSVKTFNYNYTLDIKDLKNALTDIDTLVA